MNCPYCGAGEDTRGYVPKVRPPYYDWECGTIKRGGAEMSETDNCIQSHSCELNILEAKLDRLNKELWHAFALDFPDGSEAISYLRKVYWKEFPDG